MKKILIVFTGGTIGSKKDSNKVIDIDDSKSYYLLEAYNKSFSKREVLFDTLHPLNILSEDLILGDWVTLKDTLQSVNFENYQGIIITHGSDTLPFTSAAISYMFSNTRIPIVLTASNFPLDDARSNGLRNFINCVDFILDNSLPGVYVIFENHNHEPIVHLATRLIQAWPYDYKFGNFDFESFESIHFGKMADSKLIRNENIINPEVEEILAERESINLNQVNFSSHIMYICPDPGLNYKHYNFTKSKPQAVLHNLYHSGTACTRETNEHEYSLVDFVKYCNQSDIDVYIAPITSITKDLYKSTQTLIKNGAIPIMNISLEAAIVKIMLAYGTYTDKKIIQNFLIDKNLFFECYEKVFLEHINKKKP